MRPFLLSTALVAGASWVFASHAALDQAVTLRPTSGVWSLPATLVIPQAADPVPCVVFFAGSGPTDRDWRSPLLKGSNGSGRQLAAGLATEGIGSLRFDKVGSGANMDHLEMLSLGHYVDEASVAFDYLAARPECSKVFLLGHSEGALHMTAAAVLKQSSPRFGGLILMAGPSRSLLETAIAQIRRIHESARDDMAAVNAGLESFREAIRRLPGGTPPDLVRVPEAAAIWRSATEELEATAVRELLLADPLQAARAYHGPALVLAAAHDAQVERADADRLLAALGSSPEAKRRVVIADANHVFKKDPRDPATLTAAQIAAGYAEDGRPLADGVVEAIARFVLGRSVT